MAGHSEHLVLAFISSRPTRPCNTPRQKCWRMPRSAAMSIPQKEIVVSWCKLYDGGGLGEMAGRTLVTWAVSLLLSSHAGEPSTHLTSAERLHASFPRNPSIVCKCPSLPFPRIESPGDMSFKSLSMSQPCARRPDPSACHLDMCFAGPTALRYCYAQMLVRG